MTPISILIRRMARLPRHHRIAHLRAILPNYPERSVERKNLEALLKDEMTKQLKSENRAA
jgi:hypothetical protein